MVIAKKILCLLTASCLVTACAATKPTAPSHTQYILGTGDRLKIDVYGDETLSGEFTVDVSGKISMPLIQQVEVAGQTSQSLEMLISDKLYPTYMNDPKVSVQIMEYGDVFVLGEVRLPGKYPYTPNMTVIQAVAVAGGYTYRGNESDADIMRTINGEVKEYNFKKTERIMPGDTVYVDRRWF
jgi:polysaccharide export outer membrane protein